MATIKLDFAGANLGALQRARLPMVGAGLQPVPLGVAAGIGGAVAGAGDALAQFAEAERRTAGEAEQNRARAAALRAMAEQEAAAQGDVEVYRAGTRVAFSDIAAGISDPAERSRFLSRIEPEAAAVEFRVRRTGTARRGAEAVASLEDVLRETGTRAAASDNPVERDALRAGGRERIAGAIEAGYLTPAAARTRRGQFDAEVSTATALRLTMEAPAEAVRLLRDPEQLPGLTPVQRYRLLDRAMREQERAGGGLRAGGGARRLREGELPDAPPPAPELPPDEVSAIEAEGDRQAAALDDADYQRVVVAERTGQARAAADARAAAMAWFNAAAGADVDPAEAARFTAADDLQPASLVDAARAVALTGGAQADDGEALDALLAEAGASDPAIFPAVAARAVADGRITPGGWVRLVQANEHVAGDPAWARVRSRVAEDLTPPDLADLLPGVGDLGGLRRQALAEIDAWRAAHPREGAGAAQAGTAATVAQAREAMADALIARLPQPAGLGPGPYGVPALDAAEDAVMGALDAGDLDEAEAARRLRVLDGWRWVGATLDGGDAMPNPDAPGRGMRMRVR